MGIFQDSGMVSILMLVVIAVMILMIIVTLNLSMSVNRLRKKYRSFMRGRDGQSL